MSISAVSAVSALPLVTPPSSTSAHHSVAELRAKIAQMKEKLEAVKKDPKTDCKTKDWQMQSLQQAITQAQQQVATQTAKATKAEDSTPVKAAAKNDPVNTDDSRGQLVDCYA